MTTVNQQIMREIHNEQSDLESSLDGYEVFKEFKDRKYLDDESKTLLWNITHMKLHKALLKGLDKISTLQPEIDDSQTVVIFYWDGYPLSYESAEKILLGVETIPEQLVMKVRVINKTIH